MRGINGVKDGHDDLLATSCGKIESNTMLPLSFAAAAIVGFAILAIIVTVTIAVVIIAVAITVVAGVGCG